jgi:uncharacterized protein YndB with AHSA1/START domain
MSNSQFVYVTYIRTTPEKLWRALLEPEFTRQYWMGCWQDCEWRVGAPWRLMFADGRVGDTGEVKEFDPPRRLVIAWRNEFLPELKAEGFSRMTSELEQQGGVVKLTIVHEMQRDGSVFIEKVSGGWPQILSSLKSLLETGQALSDTRVATAQTASATR